MNEEEAKSIEELKKDYAELLIRSGLNLRKGRDLL